MSKTPRQANEPGTSGSRRLILTLAGLALSTTLLTTFASAQAPPGAQGQPGTPGTPGQGGRQGRGGRMPFAMGTITGGDANARTITITPQTGNPRGGNQPGGNPPGGNAQGVATQTIQVTPSTQFVVQMTVTAADLKFGDKVQIQGVPASISASTITAGDLPDFLQFGRGRNGGGPGGGGAPVAPGAAPQNGQGNPADPNAPQTPPQAFASATGKVISTNPLTVEVNKDISIVLKLAHDAKVVKYVPTTFNNLKVGDKIIAAGQTDDNGLFTATGVGVNMDMGFGGRGGFGGFGPGGGGFGGPGGFAPGAGGFGGGNPGGAGGANGGRGRRNRGGTPGTPPADPNNP